MKFNRKILIHIASWARLKNVSFLYMSKAENGVFIRTDWKLIDKPDIFNYYHEEDVVSKGTIIWDHLVIDEPPEVADMFINHFKKKLAGYVDTDDFDPETDDISTMYPKSMIMSKEEHEAYMRHIGRVNGKTLYQSEYWKPLVNARFNTKKLPSIKDAIFNEPATIVFWKDGTKTVVKAQDEDEYDPEKGLAMAVSKKAMGNNRDYYLTFKKYLKKYEKENPTPKEDSDQISLEEAANRIAKAAFDSGVNSVSFGDGKIPMTPLYVRLSNETEYECPVCGNKRYEDGNTTDKYSWYCDCKNRSAHRKEWPCNN